MLELRTAVKQEAVLLEQQLADLVHAYDDGIKMVITLLYIYSVHSKSFRKSPTANLTVNMAYKNNGHGFLSHFFLEAEQTFG